MIVLRAELLGYCMGVRRAVDSVVKALEQPDLDELSSVQKQPNKKNRLPVYTFGPLIHNNAAVDDFTRRGVRILDDDPELSKLPRGVVVLRAHGVPPAIKKQLENAGHRTIDATCPRVLSSQKLASSYSKKGYMVIIAGDKNHGEVAGIAGCVDGSVCVVENADDARKIVLLPQKCVLLSQTTILPEEYDAIAAVLRDRNPNITVLQTICSATRERQNALEKLAKKVEGILVIGGKNSANTVRLYKRAAALSSHAAHIETAAEIPGEFFSLKIVGLSSGASTPDTVIDEVEQALLHA